MTSLYFKILWGLALAFSWITHCSSTFWASARCGPQTSPLVKQSQASGEHSDSLSSDVRLPKSSFLRQGLTISKRVYII